MNVLLNPRVKTASGGETVPESCDAVEPLLAVHLLGEITEAEAGRIEAHLLECAKCRRLWIVTKHTLRFLAVGDSEEEPTDQPTR
jgi:predicted anti-sigma-YlaC factor YlaD